MKRIHFIILIFLLLPVVVLGQVPETISYQGFLTEETGKEVSDGTYRVTFRLYAEENLSEPLWLETQTLEVRDGLFSTFIGAKEGFDLPFYQPYYLSVEVESRGESQRMALSSTPYSFVARDVADGAVVRSISGLRDEVELVAGEGIDIHQEENRLVISARVGLDERPLYEGIEEEFVWEEDMEEADWEEMDGEQGGENNGVWYWVGVGSDVGLDGAYDEGRVIMADDGPVEIMTAGSTDIGLRSKGNTAGLYGIARSTSGRGVYGVAKSTTGLTAGVLGIAKSTRGRGVYGLANSTTGTPTGVYGVTKSTSGYGVYGWAQATTGINYGVYGKTNSPDGWAGYFEGNVHVTGNLEVGGDGFVATGTYGSGSIPATGAGVRMMWYPNKAAFRPGRVMDTQWDDANIGFYSTAMGYNTTASGAASTAMGRDTEASGNHSTAMGRDTEASGEYSTAMGYNTTASGFGTIAIGASTTASGQFSAAMGELTTASGFNSTAMGRQTTAQARGSLVIGRWNTITGSTTTWTAADPLFVAGNGSSAGSPSNALTLLKNGNMTIAGTLTESSDRRLKEDLTPLSGVLEDLESLQPVYYRFREGTQRSRTRQIGLLAQDVEPVFPELVSRDASGFLSLSYAKLSAVLVQAVKEQQDEIEALIAELDQLRTQMEVLQAEVRNEAAATDARLAELEAALGRILQIASPSDGELSAVCADCELIK